MNPAKEVHVRKNVCLHTGCYSFVYLFGSPASTINSFISEVLDIESMHDFRVVFLKVQVHFWFGTFGLGAKCLMDEKPNSHSTSSNRQSC